ncbi:hypothetical protein BG004_000321 [Podila humilis]|nr:hypothetical protein BG004_000321 [Podila humilis]
MSGTQLVSWGGIQGGDVMTAVYDIATDTWLDQYTAPPPTPKVSPDSETPTGPGSESTSNVAAIVGGVCGAIAVIAIIAGLLIYKRRRNNARLSQQDHHIIDKEPALKTAGYLLDGTRTNKQDHPKHSASKPGSPETCPGNIFTVASKEEASSENLFTVCSKEEGPRNPHTTTEEQQMQTTGAPHTNNDTNPRDPQHSHDAAADPPTSDEVRLQEKKLAERKALDQLIEAHRQEQIQIHLEVQRQKEDQDRKLQLLMKQRRAL